MEAEGKGRSLGRRAWGPVFVALLASLAAACAATRPASEGGLASAASGSGAAAGTASLAVQVVLETPRGRVVPGEGTPVLLIAATTGTRLAFERDVVEGDRMPSLAPGDDVRRATTDAWGRCTFGGLAAGDYLLASPVAWRLAGEATEERTDVAYARVRVAAGERASATATRTSAATLNQY
jgi:hypothetical protein